MKFSLLIFSLTSVLLMPFLTFSYAEIDSSITQQDLKMMIEDWMNSPQEDDTSQRLEIMKAYYAFEELGGKLTNDQEGLTLMNQIRKMVSFDIPREELDEIRENVRIELGLMEPYEVKTFYVGPNIVDCVGAGAGRLGWGLR